MNINEITEILDGNLICAAPTDIDIKEVYAGDFLSRVMGNAPSGCVWLTVMGNVNVAGVASLADIKVIVLCENVQPDKLLIDKCASNQIGLISTAKNVYESCKLL